jgi:ferredoxin
VAFGSGIHRCAGSNLARMELRVALEEWLAASPSSHSAEGGRSPGPAVRSGVLAAPGGVPVKIRIDPDKCQGHARCYGLAPELFDVDDYGQASVIVDEVPPELEDKARPGHRQLPEYAIERVGD